MEPPQVPPSPPLPPPGPPLLPPPPPPLLRSGRPWAIQAPPSDVPDGGATFEESVWGIPDMFAVFFTADGAALTIATLLGVWGGLEGGALRVTMAVLSSLLLALSVVAWLRWIRPAPLSIFGRPDHVWGEIGRGVVVGIAALVANGLTVQLVREVGRTILGHYPEIAHGYTPKDPFAVVVFGVVLVILAPIGEEMFFRGFVYGGLRRKLSPRAAVPISAAAFAVAHVYLTNMIAMVVVGSIFALTYEKRRNLLPSMIAHGLNNLVVFLVTVASLHLL